jgi:hypothetical protein
VEARRAVIVGLVAAVCLIAGSTPRLPGDGGEYLAYALNFANLRGPSIATADAPAIASEIQRTIAPNDPRLAEWDVVSSTSKSKRGGHDFPHFWVYPLLAAPGVLMTRLLGVASTYAFALVNCGLLALALAVARPRLGAALSLLLFAGPILWWLDKAHSEPFSFALLTIAILLVIERPWWALVAAGLATTQNLPIVVMIPLIVGANVLFNRPVLKDRRFVIGAVTAVALAALHPLYMLWRYGLPTLQMHATVTGFPEWPEISSTIFDPTIGIIANFPALAVALVAGVAVLLARNRRAFLAPDVLVAVAATLAFLPAFAKAGNLHHGGTPSLSRYAIWLIPMAMPLLRHAAAAARLTWQRGIWALAIVSAVGSAFAFHPDIIENGRSPTWVATWLWTKHPTWNNPMPEMFIEPLARIEHFHVPVATRGCEKILFAGRGDTGVWPVPCYPEPLPADCAVVNAFCYANLTNRGYVFVPAPGRNHGAGLLRRDAVWPREVEAFVRDLYNKWDWPTLEPNSDWSRQPIRQVHECRVSSLGAPDRLIYVVQNPKPGAALFLRLPRHATGSILDPRGGVSVGDVVFRGAPFDMLEIRFPPGHDLLIVALRLEGAQ